MLLTLTQIDRVFPSHKGGPGRSTNWRHIVTVKNNSRVGQLVNMWSWDLGRAMKTDVIPALKQERYKTKIKLKKKLLFLTHARRSRKQLV